MTKRGASPFVGLFVGAVIGLVVALISLGDNVTDFGVRTVGIVWPFAASGAALGVLAQGMARVVSVLEDGADTLRSLRRIALDRNPPSDS